MSESSLLVVRDIELKGDTEPFEACLETSNGPTGIVTATLTLSAGRLSTPSPLTITFSFDSIDIYGYWNARQNIDKVNYYHSGINTGASTIPPVLCYYNNQMNNRITFALSDALNPIRIRCDLREEDLRFYVSVELFAGRSHPIRDYQIQLRIDTRCQPYYTALDDVRQWWESMKAYHPAPVPETARRPMYSTWYSYHQNLTEDAIVEECRLASTLGCKAVIIDDGWQTHDNNRGYAYTGDWQPERLTRMRDMVEQIHRLGMKVLLWYALPFVGVNSQIYQRFEGKYLHHWENAGAYVLDPRYPDVREYLTVMLETAIRDWDLDGFKLDFLDWFKVYDDTDLLPDPQRDITSVVEATDVLMSGLIDRLRTIRPNVMIEFRQPYTGPVMRKYGNMLRGIDCPNNAAANRNEITNLRLLAGRTAVHSDMITWHNPEPAHSAALQILNVLFSVPQISVRLNDLSEEHREMLGFWLNYWNQHQHVLLDGALVPGNPGSNYPFLSAQADGTQITVLYETNMAPEIGPDIHRADLINATGAKTVYLHFPDHWRQCDAIVHNASGKVVDRMSLTGLKRIHHFKVPCSGLLRCAQT